MAAAVLSLEAVTLGLTTPVMVTIADVSVSEPAARDGELLRNHPHVPRHPRRRPR